MKAAKRVQLTSQKSSRVTKALCSSYGPGVYRPVFCLDMGIAGNKCDTNQNFITDEISKDHMLYKSLYVIVAYFCIGTELRFLAVLNPSKYSIKDSEIWHAKAIHIASYFLPNDCPLIQHII